MQVHSEISGPSGFYCQRMASTAEHRYARRFGVLRPPETEIAGPLAPADSGFANAPIYRIVRGSARQFSALTCGSCNSAASSVTNTRRSEMDCPAIITSGQPFTFPACSKVCMTRAALSAALAVKGSTLTLPTIKVRACNFSFLTRPSPRKILNRNSASVTD